MYKAPPQNYECDTNTLPQTNETTEYIVAKYKPGYFNLWSTCYGLDCKRFSFLLARTDLIWGAPSIFCNMS
jgi:hypothetical protein